MKRKILFSVLILAAILYLCAAACASDTVTSSRESIVRIYGESYGTGTYTGNAVFDYGTSFHNDLIGSWTGSGFAIGKAGEDPRYFVTNRHCVDSAYSDPAFEDVASHGVKLTDKVYILTTDVSRKIPAVVVSVSQSTDLALLKVEKPISTRVPMKIRDVDPEELVGKAVYAFGFPGVGDNILSEAARAKINAETSQVTMTSGTISRIIPDTETAGGIGEVIQHNADINGGNSGGPLVDEFGLVIGVNTWSASSQGFIDEENNVHVTTSNGTFWSVSNRDLMRFLDSAGAEYETGTPPFQMTTLHYLIIGLAAVLVVIAIVMIRQKKINADQERRLKAAEERNKRGMTSMVVSALDKIRKEEEARKPVPAPVQKTSEPAVRYVLRCDKGALQGKIWKLRKELVIGRQASKCTVVVPSGTAGISGVHCAIREHREGATVIDLGSTYGTYLDGKKLVPKKEVPFHRGQKLSLGSEDGQVFTLHHPAKK